MMTRPQTWRKSSYSSEQTNCVEVTVDRANARVRDTKARQVGHIEVSALAWRTLLDHL